jgi:hypothetical protein
MARLDTGADRIRIEATFHSGNLNCLANFKFIELTFKNNNRR